MMDKFDYSIWCTCEIISNIYKHLQYIKQQCIHYFGHQSMTTSAWIKQKQDSQIKLLRQKLYWYQAWSTKSSSTLIRSKTIPLRTAIFNKFIQELENQFAFSNYISDVLTSNTFSAVKIISISRTDKSKYDINEGEWYACNPIYGVVVPLLFIDSNY